MRQLLSQVRYADAATGSALARRLCRLSASERKEEALRRRIRRSGIQVHTLEERARGARAAWRNTGCRLGRLFRESLDVVDRRHIVDPDAMQAQILRHLDNAFNDGRIKSMISILAPDCDGTAGVTMVDHHTAFNQLMKFHAREQAGGRRMAACWRGIVPLQAVPACKVFHLRMRNFHSVPNFYRNRGGDGLRLMPWYGDHYRSRVALWADRLKRRWKIGERMPW